MSEVDHTSRIVAGPLDVEPRPDRWSYLPALDGVRALAVVAVVVFHFWPDTFPGGFVGVDVFFAMSGLLITGILQTEHRRDGRVDLRAFWGRRVRRLVPAVVALVVVTSVAVVLTGTGSSRQLADALGALTWTTNLVEAFLGGSRMWLHNSRTTLDHLWSLAIEEQFYLVWPLVTVVVFRRVGTRRARVGITLALIALSALSMGLVGGVHAYFRTDTRAFELLAGAALALSGWVVARPPAWVTTLLGASGLVGLGLIVAFVDPGDDWMYPWGFLVVSVCSMLLVAAAVHPPPWMSAVLESRPMRHLGRVSYGVYLWHIPVLRILSSQRMGFDGPFLHVVRFAVLAVLVEASYRFVEEPFRRKRVRLGWPQFVGGYAGALASIALLVPATIRDRDGQWDAIDQPPTVAAGQTRVLVVGDLVGASAAYGLAKDDSLAVWSLADPGCPSASNTTYLDHGRPLDIDEFCEHWEQRWTRGIARFRPDIVVLGGGYWDTLEQRGAPNASTPAYFRGILDRQLGAIRAEDPDVEIDVVTVDDWTDLIDVRQRSRADRLAAIASYDEAVDEVAGQQAIHVIHIADLDALRTLDAAALRTR